MANYWKMVNDVIRNADIILLVLDARFPELTNNKEIEKKVLEREKKLLYVINKCDLVTQEKAEELKGEVSPAVFVSSTERHGGTLLYKKIMQLSKGEQCTVGVLGYPNVGKSSVINLLKGSKAASTSSQAGHTTGIQFVKAKGKIKLIDTPGVLQFREKDLEKQILIGAFNPQHVREPEYFAMKIVEEYPELFEKFYDMEYDGPLKFIEKAALKKNILKKGGKPDIIRFSRQLLFQWQKGNVHKKYLE